MKQMHTTIVNILPTEDLLEHLGDEFCRCKPRVFVKDGKLIVIHTNYDLKHNLRLKLYDLTLMAGQLN